MPQHVMVDLETLGNCSDALVLSIGAVKFDPHGTDIDDSFTVKIDPDSAQAFGLKIDASTVMWWMHPDRAEARAVLLTDEGVPPVDLWSALYGFTQWFGSDSLPVWGNGATFDNVILRNAFTKAGLMTPWQFWHDRCYRTLKGLAPGVALSRVGTHHDALDDARSQAKHMQAIVAHLGLQL